MRRGEAESVKENILDLLQLIFTLGKVTIFARAATRESEASFSYRRVSSAYNDTRSTKGHTISPHTASVEWSRTAMGSMVKANSHRDKGHPCPISRQR